MIVGFSSGYYGLLLLGLRIKLKALGLTSEDRFLSDRNLSLS